MKILAVDPGHISTGVITRSGDELLAFAVLTREPHEEDFAYLGRVLDEVDYQRRANDVRVLAVEGINSPTGHLGKLHPAGLLGTATVYGAVLGVYRDAYVVAPGGHGQGPRQAYPAALWGAREKRGTGMLRHCRSAFDVGGAVALLMRVAS